LALGRVPQMVLLSLCSSVWFCFRYLYQS
jgi:hypothetical protein